MKTSALSRGLELARLAARIGLKEARSSDLASRLEQAKILAQGLAELKGAAMKAGQLLSLELNDYFPPEAIEFLGRLQNAASARDFSEVDATLRCELARSYRELSAIDPVPAGVASIGQVHRAQWRGVELALKIQHPGVAESIDSDLSTLAKLAAAFCTLTGRQMDLQALFNEFRSVLEQEVDYRREAILQMRYRALVQRLGPQQGFSYVVPAVIEELSGPRVLAMEWQQGTPLRRWLSTADARQRARCAHAVLELYFHEFFRWGLVQTDPNQGNFLVRSAGDELQLVLLDFGATREYPREFITQYVRLLKAIAADDQAKLTELAVQFGLIDPREDRAAFQALFHMLAVAQRPFSRGVFDFTDQAHLKNSQEAGKQLASKLKFSPPPHRIVFLHRKLGGVYAILKSLGAQLDVASYWQRMLVEERYAD